MYSVTLQVPTKELLASVLDKIIREGATVTSVGILLAKPIVAAVAKSAPKAKSSKGNRQPRANQRVVREVIAETFGEKQFAPKQIVAVVVARGVPHGSFYTTLADMTKGGQLTRPKPGYYKLAKSKGDSNAEETKTDRAGQGGQG